MKNYKLEIITFIFQFLIFYFLPLFADPTDGIGLVFLIIIFTFALSLFYGILSNNKNNFKYIYPLIISILFLPTIPIFYNYTATIHSLWYFVISIIGLIVGTIIRFIFKFIKQKLQKK